MRSKNQEIHDRAIAHLDNPLLRRILDDLNGRRFIQDKSELWWIKARIAAIERRLIARSRTYRA